MLLLSLRSHPRGLLAVCRHLEQEAGKPETDADIVACAELGEGGTGQGVDGDDREGDEGYPGCLCKEGDCKEARLVGGSQ